MSLGGVCVSGQRSSHSSVHEDAVYGLKSFPVQKVLFQAQLDPGASMLLSRPISLSECVFHSLSPWLPSSSGSSCSEGLGSRRGGREGIRVRALEQDCAAEGFVSVPSVCGSAALDSRAIAQVFLRFSRLYSLRGVGLRINGDHVLALRRVKLAFSQHSVTVSCYHNTVRLTVIVLSA